MTLYVDLGYIKLVETRLDNVRLGLAWFIFMSYCVVFEKYMKRIIHIVKVGVFFQNCLV